MRRQFGGVEGEHHRAVVIEGDHLWRGFGCTGRWRGRVLFQWAAHVVNRRVGRGLGAVIAPVENAVTIFVTVLGVTNQPAYNGAQGATTGGPGRTLDGTKATTDQAAQQAADGPGPLIEGRAAIAVRSAAREQAGSHQQRQSRLRRHTHAECSCVIGHKRLAGMKTRPCHCSRHGRLPSYRWILISVRRFMARPSAVALSATGWVSPAPTTETKLLRGTPLSTR